VALVFFIIYGFLIILFPYAIWSNSFFTDRHYPPGVNPNCLECPSPSATPLAELR
jgi:hypothetical protein